MEVLLVFYHDIKVSNYKLDELGPDAWSLKDPGPFFHIIKHDFGKVWAMTYTKFIVFCHKPKMH